MQKKTQHISAMFTGRVSPSGQDVIRTGKDWALVLDGHGLYGLQVAEAVADMAEGLLKDGKCLYSEALEGAADVALAGKPMPLPGAALGGTTFTAIQIRAQEIEFQWVGDSAGYLIIQDDRPKMWRTTNHDPTNASEFARIRSCGGICVYHPKRQPVFDESGQRIGYDTEPAALALKDYWTAKDALDLDPQDADLQSRVVECKRAYDRAGPKPCAFQSFVKKNVSGEFATYFVSPLLELAVTRAFGDTRAEKFGLSHELDRCTISISGAHGVAFAASDGVHDCFTSEELIGLILNTQADDELWEIFTSRAKSLFPKPDDISFVRRYF